jgi:hypothetical protein
LDIGDIRREKQSYSQIHSILKPPGWKRFRTARLFNEPQFSNHKDYSKSALATGSSLFLDHYGSWQEVGRIPKAEVTLHRKEGIMKGTNSWPDVMSRYLKRSKTSLGKWFNSIPNLAAAGDTSVHDATNSGAREVVGLDHDQRYHDLLVKLQRDHSGATAEGERPRSVQQLQEIVNDIVRERKEKMAKAHSKEEILMEFMTGLYKIKSLL